MTARDQLSARAVYLAGGVFTLSQIANLCFMTYAYGGWTIDHWIATVVIGVIFVATNLLRWTKNFNAYAIFILPLYYWLWRGPPFQMEQVLTLLCCPHWLAPPLFQALWLDGELWPVMRFVL